MGLPLLGCIADDFTGATDLANTLVRGGIRTIQTIGVPPPGWDGGEADALVVALKSWTVPAAEAVADSLRTLERVALSGPTPGRPLLASYGVLAPHGEDKPWGS